MTRLSNIVVIAVGITFLLAGGAGLVSFLLRGDVISSFLLSCSFLVIGIWLVRGALANWRAEVGVLDATSVPTAVKLIGSAALVAVLFLGAVALGAYLLAAQRLFRAAYYGMLVAFAGILLVLAWYGLWRGLVFIRNVRRDDERRETRR